MGAHRNRVEAVARMLGVSERTVTSWGKKGGGRLEALAHIGLAYVRGGDQLAAAARDEWEQRPLELRHRDELR